MSFERALAAAREDLERPAALPSLAAVEAAALWRRDDATRPRPSSGARWLASLGAAVAVLTMITDAYFGMALATGLLTPLLHPTVLGLSLVLIHRSTMGSQLVSRAVWWSFLLFGFGWSFGDADALPAAGAIVTIGCGLALLATGRVGLRRPETKERFDPRVFRGLLLATMVLGLSDAMMLGWMGSLFVEVGAWDRHPVAILACSGLLAVCVTGLARLRVWALLLSLPVNVGVIGLLSTMARSSPFSWIVASSALLHLLLTSRMLLALWRGTPAREPTELPNRLGTAVIVLATLVSVPAALLNTYLPILERLTP